MNTNTNNYLDKISQAVILAAGEGTRLKPYTDLIPKAMLPINGKPLISWIINHLKKHDTKEIIICANKKFENLLKDYIGNGQRFGVKISFSISSKPLGTLGEVLNCKNKLKKKFLLYYGDEITDMDLSAMKKIHVNEKADLTLGLAKVQSDYGLVHYDSSKRITRFQEKPLIDHLVWTGIAVINKELLRNTKGSDFAKDLFPKYLKNKKIMAYVTNSTWIDIGTIRNFEKANQFLKSKKL